MDVRLIVQYSIDSVGSNLKFGGIFTPLAPASHPPLTFPLDVAQVGSCLVIASPLRSFHSTDAHNTWASVLKSSPFPPPCLSLQLLCLFSVLFFYHAVRLTLVSLILCLLSLCQEALIS